MSACWVRRDAHRNLNQTALGVAAIFASLSLVGCGGGSATGGKSAPASTPVTDASPSVASPSVEQSTATPQSTPSESLPQHGYTKSADGMIHSDTKSTGVYQNSTIEIANTLPGNVRTYTVKVEDSVGLDPNQVATEVQALLDDPRGWTPLEGQAFKLVADPAQAEFTISLASPATTDAACLPLDTVGTWSCRNGMTVNFNSDRWLYATPTYDGHTIHEYRAYLVNHEVGHYIGHDHVGCPSPGAPAPVMMQQSIDLFGCKPQPWPNGA